VSVIVRVFVSAIKRRKGASGVRDTVMIEDTELMYSKHLSV